MPNEFEPKGNKEPLVKRGRLSGLLGDAVLALRIRNEVDENLERLKLNRSEVGLVMDRLMSDNPGFKELVDGVKHPIVHRLPTPVLRVLAAFADSGRLY